MSEKDCPPRVKLLALVDAGEHVPHLRECEKCAKFVSTATAAVKAFTDRTELQRVLSERLDAVLANTYGSHRVASALYNATDLHRSIVVRELLRRAEKYRGADPARYLDLTKAAVVVCEEMTSAGHPPEPELFIEALREQSTALRQRGALDEALAELERAGELLPQTRQPELHRAVLSLYVAIIDAQPDRAKFDEATRLAEAAWAVLELCGDERRAVLARQTKAYVLVVENKFAAALPLLRDVVAELDRAAGQWATPRDIAVAYTSLAHCLVGVGLYYEGGRAAELAQRLHLEGGGISDAARAAHIRARALAGMGQFDEAQPEFNRTAEIVFGASLFDEWAIMRLDYVAAALAADESADVKAELVTVAQVCLATSANRATVRQRYAAEAMAYLRQLAVRDAVTSEAVDYVRTYVERNATRPPVKFSPPRGGTFVM